MVYFQMTGKKQGSRLFIKMGARKTVGTTDLPLYFKLSPKYSIRIKQVFGRATRLLSLLALTDSWLLNIDSGLINGVLFLDLHLTLSIIRYWLESFIYMAFKIHLLNGLTPIYTTGDRCARLVVNRNINCEVPHAGIEPRPTSLFDIH